MQYIKEHNIKYKKTNDPNLITKPIHNLQPSILEEFNKQPNLGNDELTNYEQYE